jgi:hypothetical protein
MADHRKSNFYESVIVYDFSGWIELGEREVEERILYFQSRHNAGLNTDISSNII